MNRKVTIVDAPCGTGKTTAAINMINDSNENEKFLYITPFLSEVQRIKSECMNKNFYEPEVLGTKFKGMMQLLNKHHNIVSTHSLFNKMSKESIDSGIFKDYTLILDEVADVVQPFVLSAHDRILIRTKFTRKDKNHKLVWKDPTYSGKFDDIKRLCQLGCLYVYNQIFFLWLFPVSVFDAFKHVYILTYMYDCQIQHYYYQFYNVSEEKKYIKDFRIVDDKVDYDIDSYKKLINIYNGDNLNKIGDEQYSLCVSWFDEMSKTDVDKIASLKNNTYNYFRHIVKSPSELNAWTCFKDYKQKVSGKGYSRGFIPINARATNNYSNKQDLAYLANVYLNPNVKNFFVSKGISADEDQYALSELIQWIFRSQIRKQLPVNIYIPSKRMRTLLNDWK